MPARFGSPLGFLPHDFIFLDFSPPTGRLETFRGEGGGE